MKTKINSLIEKLKKDNLIRAEKMNTDTTQYYHTILFHKYNLTLEFIKELEKL